MSKDKEWGDHLVLQAVVDAFDIHITVINVFQYDVRRTILQPESNAKRRRIRIFLGTLENSIIWVCDQGTGAINGLVVNFFFIKIQSENTYKYINEIRLNLKWCTRSSNCLKFLILENATALYVYNVNYSS